MSRHLDENDKIRNYKVLIYRRIVLLGFWLTVSVGVYRLVVEGVNVSLLYNTFFAILFSSWIWLFHNSGDKYLKLFEDVFFWILFVYFLLIFAIDATNILGGQGLTLHTTQIWAPIVYVFAFIIFPPRRAVLTTMAFLLGTMIFGLIYVTRNWGAPELGDDILLLGEIYGAAIAYISLLSTIALLKEQYVETKIQAQLMTHLAHTDSLTGSYSRKKIEDYFELVLEQSKTTAQPLSILMIDVDNLKKINDVYGHDMGDYFLRRTSELLRGVLREQDALGRIGGDEFLLICPHTNLEQARALAKRLEATISSAEYETIGHGTISLGLATYQPNDTGERMCKRADQAMYAHKQAKKM